MTEGVAVVQDLATDTARRRGRRRLPEVLSDDVGLDLDSTSDQIGDALAIRVDARLCISLDIREDRRIGGEADLHDLGHAGDEVVLRQGLQRGQVAQDARRAVEGADEILASSGVDPGLASDRRVDHCQQRRRDMHDADPAKPRCGDEAGEIGRRTPTEADDRVIARETRLPQDGPAECEDLGGLRVLGLRDLDEDGVVALISEVCSNRLRAHVQRRRVDHGHARGALEHRAELAEEASSDVDVIGALGDDVDHVLAHVRPPIGDRAPQGLRRRSRAPCDRSCR